MSTVVRALPLPARSLEESLVELASALQPGADETWVITGGPHTLTALVQVGRPDATLRLRGPARIEVAQGLALTGAEVEVADLDLVLVGGTGDRTLLAVVATVANLTGVTLTGAPAVADRVVGLALDATEARVAQVVVRDLAGAEVTGLSLDADELLVLSCAAERLVSAGSVEGVRLVGQRVAVTGLALADLQGGGAGTGLFVRASHADAGEDAIALVDCRLDGLTAGGEAVGVHAASAGGLRVRGARIAQVQGARAHGLLLVAAGAVDLLAADVRSVVGGAGGAAGVRVVAPAGTAPVELRDLEVVGVAGGDPATNGGAPAPSFGWDDWASTLADPLATGSPLPPLPPVGPELAADATGLSVAALVTGNEPWADDLDPGALLLEQIRLHLVAGAALIASAGARDLDLRGAELSMSLAPGYLEGERVLVSWCTVHRTARPLVVGPADLHLANLLLTATGGDPLLLDPDVRIESAGAVFGDAGDWPVTRLAAVPYLDPGPALPAELSAGALPAVPPVLDLQLSDRHLHDLAVPVVGEEGAAPFVGAYPPVEAPGCELRDPAPPPVALPAPAEPPGPELDYRARDARALLALMRDRAKVTLPDWTEQGAADLTTMVLELVAHQLDRIAYAQERAVAEGFLETALLRRSVEDHARLLDYRPDPGLAATAMIRVELDRLEEIALRIEAVTGATDPSQTPLERITGGRPSVVLGAGTLIGTAEGLEPAVFSTEDDLEVHPTLHELVLVEPIEAGASTAELQGDHEALHPGRWLILSGAEGQPLHVVRVTRVELAGDTTVVRWDPRRPAPARYPEGSRVFGNVVPASHGIRLTPIGAAATDPTAPDAAAADPLAFLEPWREKLTLTVDGATTREVDLPVGPVTVHAPGWPLPGQVRTGTPQIEVEVDGERWRRVEDLCLASPAEAVFVLRPGRDGGSALRFGDGTNGRALPRRPVTVGLTLTLALGGVGNVGAGVLQRVLAFGADAEGRFSELSQRVALIGDADLWLRRLFRVHNPLMATGGRPAVSSEEIRYDAPRAVRDRLSAVVPADYEVLLGALDEVLASRAQVVDVGLRRVVRVTLLLRDEDTLDPDERLRRWAVARRRLEEIRLLGFDVELVPPTWVPLDVDVVVDAAPDWPRETVRQAVLRSIHGPGGLFDPDTSGLGGDVHLDALYRAVLGTPGVEAARVRRFRRLEHRAVEHREDGRIPIGPDEVAVVDPPYRVAGQGPGDTSRGVVTVTVCGGRP